MFATHPLVGVAMFIFGSLVFGILAHSVVTNGPLLAWDVPLANMLHTMAHDAPPWVDALMIAAYYIGNQFIAVIGVVLGIYFLRQHCWRELVMLVNGFALSAILFWVLVHTFDRPRPDFDVPVWREQNLPSFPSGHAIAVACSYGLLLYFFVPKISSRSRKIWVLVGGALVSLWVLFSRAYLGGHYLTDLVAGYAVGIAWSGLAHTVVEGICRKRKRVQPAQRSGLALPR